VTIGRKLKHWLESQRLTQVAFVECMKAKDDTVKVDQADVSKWVNDKKTPSEHQRLVIQAITGITSIEWLGPEMQKLAESIPPGGKGEGCD
jgi:hypothetical protein